jgi:hypothetical protein
MALPYPGVVDRLAHCASTGCDECLDVTCPIPQTHEIGKQIVLSPATLRFLRSAIEVILRSAYNQLTAIFI